MSDFVHLHCHTEYSLLDGAIRLGDLCARAKDFGSPAVAITDHGNLYGALYFYLEAKKYGIKPIIGCEVYVAHHSHDDKTSAEARRRYHLVLLAQNLTGYQNLIKLVTHAQLYGFYHKPRVDKQLLQQHNEGLIALSACLAGEVPRMAMRESMDAGIAAAKQYADIFKDRFYIELQSNGLQEQVECNDKLLEISSHLNLPLVATNDCHYLNADDVEAHDILLCIQTAAKVDDAKRMRFDTKELYYKTPEEMEADFRHVPDALANTVRIAEACNLELDLGRYIFPIYDLPEGKTPHDEFVELSRKGLEERLANMPEGEEVDEKVYWDRLQVELDVIKEMGFESYFLIVQEFINWGKDNGIPVGPGRGSAAGSLVAYALRITNLDPIPYNLLFERFLNIERISMPDIDIDFCERRRTEVIQYVSDKYGEDKVSQITTFGKMKTKAVIKDVGRALGFSFGDTDKIAKLVPDEFKMSIDKALDMEPEMKALYDTDENIKYLIDISRRLEGLCRHASTHAAGVVIGDKPLTEYVPLYRGKRDEIVSQYDMKMVEKAGLIKFDFLGLRTMTLIQDTLDIIAQQGKTPPDLDTLALNDTATYELYSRGDTDGVFQVESSGMRKYLRMLKPSCFDDLIAMLALYRPGPLGSGMVDEFIKRKHGEVPVVYPLPSLEDALKSTYGVIVYQEQVMRIAQIVANYTLGGADLLRRAMGKKIAEAMAEQRVLFVDGAKENDVDEKKANEIFDLMEKFAEYGFNKSHSAAYALISYHTGYLKVHYPTEFMAALLTSEVQNQDKVLMYIAACADMDIKVLPPDVNASYSMFSVQDGNIIFGLVGVKGVGAEAIREIVESREKDGPFKSLLDLCSRVNLRKVTKRVLDHLIKAGAFDNIGCTRAGLLASLDTTVTKAQRKAKERDSGQISMFGMLGGGEQPSTPGVGYPCEEQNMEEWPDDVKSGFEKDALGFYLTSHPLMPFRSKINRIDSMLLSEVKDMADNADVKVALIATDKKERLNKRNEKWAICMCEDLSSRMEVLFFSRAFEECKDVLAAGQPILVRARVKVDEEGDDESPRQVKLLGESVELLANISDPVDKPIMLLIKGEWMGNGGMEKFKTLLQEHKGRTPVQVRLELDEGACNLELGPNYTIQVGPEFDIAYKQYKEHCEAEHAQ